MARKQANGVEASGASTSEKITKADAVRKALAAGRVMPQDAVAYIKEQFGIEMTPQQFSTAKNAEKHRVGKVRRKVGRKPGKQTSDSSTSSTVSHGIVSRPNSATGSFVDHAEAIKRAVASLGADQVKRIVGLFE